MTSGSATTTARPPTTNPSTVPTGTGSPASTAMPRTTGPGTTGPTTTDNWRTSTPTPYTPDIPGYSTDPAHVLISVEQVDAGVDGVRSTGRTLVFGDGRVVVTSPDSVSGLSELRIDQRSLRGLITEAAGRGLLTGTSFGEPGITDQGWTTVTFDTDLGLVEHRVYAPGFTDGLDEMQVVAREDMAAFENLLLSTLNTDPLDLPADYLPAEIEIRATMAFPADGQATEPVVAWPFARSARKLFGDNGCTILPSEQVRGLLDEIVVEEPLTGSGDRRVVVDTGVDSPASLALVLTFPTGRATCSPPDVVAVSLATPWPADDRRATDQWARWLADDAVHTLAAAGALGPEAGDDSDLSWYRLLYSTGEVKGRTVVDVTGEALGSARDPETFAVRIDGRTGEVLRSAAD